MMNLVGNMYWLGSLETRYIRGRSEPSTAHNRGNFSKSLAHRKQPLCSATHIVQAVHSPRMQRVR